MEMFDSEPEAFAKYTPLILEAIPYVIPKGNTVLESMLKYHLGLIDEQGNPAELPQLGKLMRPILALTVCEALGGKPEDTVNAALALELMHNFTLIHDDIQDEDEIRRGRATVWKIWGKNMAINAGDALFTIATKASLSTQLSPGKRLRIANVILDAIYEVIRGQCMDLQIEGKPSTSEASYIRMVKAKTGALIGASFQVGAISSGANIATVNKLKNAGVLLGIAFQIKDDWLGVWGESSKTGKSNTNDVQQRKVGYPVIAAYSLADSATRQKLSRLYNNKDPRLSTEIYKILDSTDSSAKTLNAARQYKQMSDKFLLSVLPESPASASLVSLSNYVVARDR